MAEGFHATDETLAADPETEAAYSISDERRPRVLADRYELLGLLGVGGMGAVYRVRDRELSELVALKMLRPELGQDEVALARFRQEVRLARKVTHPNVARTFDIGEHAGERFLTMELVDGPSLRALERRPDHLEEDHQQNARGDAGREAADDRTRTALAREEGDDGAEETRHQNHRAGHQGALARLRETARGQEEVRDAEQQESRGRKLVHLVLRDGRV
jgi:hypothetical protein